MRSIFSLALASFASLVSVSLAADWPQWRGPNRDAKVTGFTAPAAWPKELTKKWSVNVGDGVATPALVGDKLYAFARQGNEEVTKCLDAATGKEIWQDKYMAAAVQGPAARFPGTRSSPAVADGKVCTLGAAGVLSCLDATSGKVLWRKEDLKGVPQFYTGSSPIIVDGKCIAQLGGRGSGGIVAYDLASGEERWKWTGDSPAYGSPILVTAAGAKAIVAPTDRKLVAVNVQDGKLLWEVNYSQGRYNAATPIVDGQRLIYAGPGQGMTAEKLEKKGDELEAMQLWKNDDNSLIYNTPVLKDGLLYGISTTNVLFCVDANSGKTAWNAPLSGQAGGQPPPAAAPPQGKGGKGGRGGGGGNAGYGSVVDAGSVLFALTPAAQLIVFQPSSTEFKQVASYKVADEGTFAYPVLSGNRIYIKDKDSVSLFTVE
jgi:outer membrane protein assembly factor BamB